ncbi:MAG TPA: glycoside hydrolase family 65 protein, partial [Sphingobacteriaceae bacterium]
MNFRKLLAIGLAIVWFNGFAQGKIDPWTITADKIDPANYYGITVANGMIGVVSAPEPFKVKNVVLAGAYDLYGRGRVSNFLNSFNLLNMNVDINGKRVDAKGVKNFRQSLDMRNAAFTTSFDYGDLATVTYTYYSLRQLPYTVLMDVTVTAKKEVVISPSSVMEAPDALKEVQNYYNEIDRPHVILSLLTSSAKSPTGKLQLAAST